MAACAASERVIRASGTNRAESAGGGMSTWRRRGRFYCGGRMEPRPRVSGFVLAPGIGRVAPLEGRADGGWVGTSVVDVRQPPRHALEPHQRLAFVERLRPAWAGIRGASLTAQAVRRTASPRTCSKRGAGPAVGAVDAGPCGYFDDTDLYARDRRTTEGDLQSAPPSRVTTLGDSVPRRENGRCLITCTCSKAGSTRPSSAPLIAHAGAAGRGNLHQRLPHRRRRSRRDLGDAYPRSRLSRWRAIPRVSRANWRKAEGASSTKMKSRGTWRCQAGDVDGSACGARGDLSAARSLPGDALVHDHARTLRRRGFFSNAVANPSNAASRAWLLDPTQRLGRPRKPRGPRALHPVLSNQPVRLPRRAPFASAGRMEFKLEPRTEEWFKLALERGSATCHLSRRRQGSELRQAAREDKPVQILKAGRRATCSSPSRSSWYGAPSALRNDRSYSTRARRRLPPESVLFFAPVTFAMLGRLKDRELTNALESPSNFAAQETRGRSPRSKTAPSKAYRGTGRAQDGLSGRCLRFS